MTAFQDHAFNITTIDTYFERPKLAASHLIVEGQRAAFIDTGTTFSVPHLLKVLTLKKIPFENIDYIYNGIDLNIKNLIRRFEQYLRDNKSWLMRDAPRRKSDLSICEATFHFILYGWLNQFLYHKALIIPEFPTGNGKVDLLIKMDGKNFGLELKSFVDVYILKSTIKQAALYAKQLKMNEFYLVIFIESIDDTNRTKYEIANLDEETGVTIHTVFVVTGE